MRILGIVLNIFFAVVLAFIFLQKFLLPFLGTVVLLGLSEALELLLLRPLPSLAMLLLPAPFVIQAIYLARGKWAILPLITSYLVLVLAVIGVVSGTVALITVQEFETDALIGLSLGSVIGATAWISSNQIRGFKPGTV